MLPPGPLPETTPNESVSDAVIVAFPQSGPATVSKLVLVLPAGTVTLAGTGRTVGLELVKDMTVEVVGRVVPVIAKPTPTFTVPPTCWVQAWIPETTHSPPLGKITAASETLTPRICEGGAGAGAGGGGFPCCAPALAAEPSTIAPAMSVAAPARQARAAMSNFGPCPLRRTRRCVWQPSAAVTAHLKDTPPRTRTIFANGQGLKTV